MRKKVLSVLLCATLVAGIAVGCGSKSSSEKSSADAKKSDKKVITVGCEATTPGWIQTENSQVMTMMYGRRLERESVMRLTIKSWNGTAFG